MAKRAKPKLQPPMPWDRWVSEDELAAEILLAEIRETFQYFPAYEKPDPDDPLYSEIPF